MSKPNHIKTIETGYIHPYTPLDDVTLLHCRIYLPAILVGLTMSAVGGGCDGS